MSMSAQLFLVMFAGLYLGSSAIASAIEPVNLQCEYYSSPLNVDVPRPRLSWIMSSPPQGAAQAAYQVLVASTLPQLSADQGDLWNSGKVASAESIQIPYEGKSLASSQQCFWKVRVWDENDHPTPWSQIATWSMGKLRPADWTAQWICAPGAGNANSSALGHAGLARPPTTAHAITSLPIFRRSFRLTKPPTRAVLYICGLGQYELHLNGNKVGNTLLDPGWTDYRKTCLYQAYDLTDQLRPGENVIGVMLGNGMYNVLATRGRYSKFVGSMGPPKLIGQLEITYGDGSSQMLGTDNSWKVAAGPITFSSTYGGEDYDTRDLPSGWDSVDGDDSNWQSATATTGPGGRLVGCSQSAPPITVAQILKSQKLTHPAPDAWVYDLGQNCALMPSITVTGPAGATVRMTPGEVLRRNGTISQQPSGGPVYFSYTLKGGGPETWAPRFTYYGSRYIQLSGAVPAGFPNPANLPVVTDLHGLFITSTSAVAGDFSCSNEMFNQTARIIRWAMRSNMMSVLTDCPHREKLGWLEQVHLVGPSLMYNFEVPALFTKISGDTADAQLADGMVPDIAPEYTVFSGGFRDSPEWGSACVLIPWQVYQWYGDSQILARRYQTMKRYVDYLSTTAKGNIVSHGLGDWYDLGPKPPGYAQLTPIPLTATAFYYRDIVILQQAAKLLGHDDDSTYYAKLGHAVKDSFNALLYHPETHNYAGGSQAANAIPLVMKLAPDSDRAAIMENIVKDIRAHHNGLTAGDIGYRYLLRALADGGRSDVIFDMNIRSDRPGYGMMLAKGATSLTEAWDARVDSSQDHFMLGHIMEWFYSDLAGIQPDPTSVGFKKIIIKPTPVGDITWARADYLSVRGMIRSSWAVHENIFSLKVEIPSGCTAAVYLPKQYNSLITEEGKPVAGIEAVAGQSGLPPSSVIRISSGTYEFQSHAN
jgi:alpha-L-rhamnosidase